MSLTYSKEFIIQEYNQSAEHPEEFRKVKWGSLESMMNRFYLAMNELPFSKMSDWIDVGCGTGQLANILGIKWGRGSSRKTRLTM